MKKKFRTDLAIENKELYDEARKKAGEIDGVIMEKNQPSEGISVVTIDIVNENGKDLLGKEIGKYVTLEVDGILSGEEGIIEKTSKILGEQLKKFIKFHYYIKVLVVGLGNERVTPDSLGPYTVSKVKVTSHLFKLFDCDGDEEMGNVCGISPGVTGVTGIETVDLIKNVVDMIKPEAVIVIDALAARNINRVSTTIQLCDTGISPGAGMGNNREAINQQSLGVKVIAIGVPTVIDSKTIVREAMEDVGIGEERQDKYLRDKNLDMIVTSTDIDILIQSFSDIISKGINITLHPGIYS